MQYRRLGSAGCKVSTISLGSWLTYGDAVSQEISERCVETAFELGINFFDTADVYHRGEVESALGKVLNPLRRQDYVLASKTFFPMSDGVNDRGLSRKHVMESCEGSLRRLGTDYLDLYQCHRFDHDVSVEELVRAMDDLIRQGKVLYWGVSMWSAEQITRACTSADRLLACRPVTNQPRYSLLAREIEPEVLPTSQRHGLGQIVFSPLAQGLLTGKYRGGAVPAGSRAADQQRGQFLRPRLTESNLERAAAIARIAGDVGVTPAQLALAWLLHQPGVSSAIIGATHPDQIEENVQATDLELDAACLERLDQLTRERPEDLEG